jgi:sodium-dependent dicarboxylate transporter 2/3/5
MEAASFTSIKKLGLVTGPLLWLFFLSWPADIISQQADPVLGVALWMLVWWLSECRSISTTALLPLVLFPLQGSMDLRSVASHYADPVIFLFFGGFILAIALEKVQLHKRIALLIIRATGTAARNLILGFMLATALLSMWISNTASTLVMLPIGLSLLDLLRHDQDGFTKSDRQFALCLVLSIAYSANIGGISTMIGTPPNMVLIGFLESQYEIQISFLSWMMLGLPFALIMLLAAYFILCYLLFPIGRIQFDAAADLVEEELRKLGRMQGQEKMVLVVFLMAIALWISKDLINQGLEAAQFSLRLGNTSISLLAAMALLAIPNSWKRGEFILDWEDTRRLPWGILILFGGGLSLAAALSQSGIVSLITDEIAGIPGISFTLLQVLIIACMLFMTEMMSNVALVTIFLPVLAAMAVGLGQLPESLCIPVTMASSCAFMLPMATPPNAIVFSSGHVKVAEMARAGILINVMAVLLLAIFSRTLLLWIF